MGKEGEVCPRGCGKVVRIWFGVEIWCVLDAFHKQMERRNDGSNSNSRQRQSGKSGVCNVLHRCQGCNSMDAPLQAMSNELDDHSARNQGGCEGVKGPGLRGPRDCDEEGRLHGMIRFLTGGRKKREKIKSNEGKERRFCSTLKPDFFPLVCPTAALSSTKFPHRTFFEAQPVLDLCPTTLFSQPPSAAALRPHWTQPWTTRTHNHRNHSHQIRIQPFSTLLRFLPQLLYKLLPPPHLVILRPFSFCSGVPLQKRKLEINRSTTHTGSKDFFPALPRCFTTALG